MYAVLAAEQLTQELMIFRGRGKSSSSSSNAKVREACAYRSSRAGILESHRRLLRLGHVLQQPGWPLRRAWRAASLQACQLPSLLHQLPCKPGTGGVSSSLGSVSINLSVPQRNT